MSSRSTRPAEGRIEPRGRASKSDGKPRRARGDRAGDVLRHPLAIAALSALVAGWLLPAFAHQWQDRQKERDLKRELATELDREVTRTVVAAQLLMTRAFPEAQAADVRRAEYERDRRLRSSYLQALERERAAGTEAFLRVVSDWLVTRSVTRSALATHFAEDDLASHWIEYANHVTDYVTLASARPRADRTRASALDRLSDYLRGGETSRWRLLERPPRQAGPRAFRAYGGAAGHLAGTLLLRKNDLVEEILGSHAAGFSTRPRDLLEDLLPFVG